MKEPIYLIELFAGIGSQAKALKNIGLNVIHHKVIEFDKYAIASYNAIHNTNFKPTDITTIKGQDLEILNTQFYNYLMTYSFPCQDLSLAGKGAGMTKGNSTRSGLLWEVERLLNECKELPQYLLLENVPQIHSKKNIDDFKLWQKFLESKGYNNYWQDLNAKNYGILQNRNRTFMISIRKDIDLGYDFPQPFELKLRLKDMLEDEVDEKYYLSGTKVNTLINELVETEQIKELPCCCDSSINEPKVREISNCITARYNAGIQNQQQIGLCVIEPNIFIKGNKAITETLEKNKVNDGDYIDAYNRIVRKDNIAGTITTRVDASNCSYICIKEKTKKGYAEATEGDGVYIDRPHQKRGCVQKDMIQTIKTSPNDIGVVVKDTRNMKERLCDELIEKGLVKENDVIRHSYTSSRMKGEMKDIQENNISPTLDTRCDCLGVAIGYPLRIRKLTPKECWRLMGFDDSDVEKAAKVNSNAQLYKQAGNSIVVNVLEHIFKELFKECKEKKQRKERYQKMSIFDFIGE